MGMGEFDEFIAHQCFFPDVVNLTHYEHNCWVEVLGGADGLMYCSRNNSPSFSSVHTVPGPVPGLVPLPGQCCAHLFRSDLFEPLFLFSQVAAQVSLARQGRDDERIIQESGRPSNGSSSPNSVA